MSIEHNTEDDQNSIRSASEITEELIAKEKSSQEAEANPTSESGSEALIDDDYSGVVVNEISSLEDQIEPKILETEMQDSYLKYAMSVIVSRALPDVRDGMKPVHRRIIYVMDKVGLTPGAKYRKSAQVVGEVLGKYHPHGDVAVYDSLVRMAQEFSLRYPLVDGQGNFGSIDGDSAAAMRYTECRLAKPATYLVQDIDKDTVDFVDNYDGSHKEPRVLPNLLPNLLINGTTGIAVGMATSIPPHNLTEVCDAVLLLLDNPEATIEDLAEIIKGPDLPTGATIYGKNDLLQAYKTGRGKVTVRSKAELTEDAIIITEIPYQINKADMLIKIAELIKDKKIEGIRDIRDESNKDGIRVVVECKRDASPEVVLNQLYKMSDLQVNLHFNLIALVNDGRQPKLLNLKEILEEFLAHRFNIVTRRTQFDLNKAQAELHILDGLKIALDFIDEVVALIRASYDKEEASKKLQERFNLSQKQAEAILQMRLQTLTNLDKTKIEEQRQALIKFIAELTLILENTEVKKKLVADEIKEVATKLFTPRRTQIIPTSISEYNKEDFIEDETVLVQLTKEQYMKVLPVTEFRQQGRGGRGVSSFNAKDEDWVKSSMVANSHDFVYAFTNTGRVFKTRVFELPSGSRTGRGQNLVNYFELKEGEKITNILTMSKDQEANKEGSLIFATEKGTVKRTYLENFNNVRKTGIIAITLDEDDALIGVALSLSNQDNIVLSASNGRTVIFGCEQLRPMGRSAGGVRGLRLKSGEKLISLQVSAFGFAEGGEEDDTTTGSGQQEVLVPSDKDKKYPSLLVITENGFGKHTHLSDYRKTARAASGVKTLNMTKKTGKPVLVQILDGSEDSLIVTTKNGITIRISPEEVPQLGRSTQGVKVIRLEDKDLVVSGGVS